MTQHTSRSARVPSSADSLYVSNQGNESITVYAHDVSGDSAPKYVIAGSKTGLTNVGQLSEDFQGNLYAANDSSLLVVAHGVSGNVDRSGSLVDGTLVSTT